MAHLLWHDYILMTSFLACITGIVLLLTSNSTPQEEEDANEGMLLLMSFAYWMVYCLAVGMQKFELPEWDMLAQSLKLTGIIAYLLTWSCILTLPLYRFATRYIEE